MNAKTTPLKSSQKQTKPAKALGANKKLISPKGKVSTTKKISSRPKAITPISKQGNSMLIKPNLKIVK